MIRDRGGSIQSMIERSCRRGLNDVLVGVITVDDVLDVAEQEATEDIQKLGGMEALDAPYLKIGMLSMIQKRAGWLAILFVGEMLTATAMDISRMKSLKPWCLLVCAVDHFQRWQFGFASDVNHPSAGRARHHLGDWWRVIRRELVAGLALDACWPRLRWCGFYYGRTKKRCTASIIC